MLLDTASLYFRAFFGVPSSIRASDGTSVNAVRGLLDFVATLVERHRPDRLVAAADQDWRPRWRVELVPSYKQHRVDRVDPDGRSIEQVPEELDAQIPIIVEVLRALGIPFVGAPDCEADDVIGTLATDAGVPVDVVTGDRDLFQLVNDAAQVRVLYTARGVGKLEAFDEAAVRSKYGVPPQAYADFATLRGDPSDGLPGVPGVGDKTAARLITVHPSLRDLLLAAEGGSASGGASSAALAKVRGSGDYLRRAAEVVRVRTDVELGSFSDALPAAPADPDAWAGLVERWNLGSAANRVTDALAAAARERGH